MSQSGRAQLDKRRPLLSLLDRLLDEAPDQPQDRALSGPEAMEALRRGIRRDLQALLNTRRRWRSWPAELTELEQSVIGYGIPDFSTGSLADAARRARLCAEIEETIRRFEPRIRPGSVRVRARESREDQAVPTLVFDIHGELWAQPVPQQLFLETAIDINTRLAVVTDARARG